MFLVFWSVDTNGRVFHSHAGGVDQPRPHVIVDREGVEWAVREIETPQSWARGAHCLVLNSRDCVRRIWSYPVEWRRLDADVLLSLGVVGDGGVETRPTDSP